MQETEDKRLLTALKKLLCDSRNCTLRFELLKLDFRTYDWGQGCSPRGDCVPALLRTPPRPHVRTSCSTWLSDS